MRAVTFSKILLLTVRRYDEVDSYEMRACLHIVMCQPALARDA